jgi:hypothetical protein
MFNNKKIIQKILPPPLVRGKTAGAFFKAHPPPPPQLDMGAWLTFHTRIKFDVQTVNNTSMYCQVGRNTLSEFDEKSYMRRKKRQNKKRATKVTKKNNVEVLLK